MPPPAVRRPYRDFLQAAFQRRFALTALLLLVLSGLESLTLTRWKTLWSIGSSSIRTLAIFLSSIFVLLLRVAHAHVGIRTTDSPFATFSQYALSLRTAETFLTYMTSAMLFSTVYRSAIADEANFHWIIYHQGSDRGRLNEQALFFTVTLIMVGISEAFLYWFADKDCLTLGCVQPKPEAENDKPATPLKDPVEDIFFSVPFLVLRSLTISLTTVLSSYVILYWFVRGTVWQWAMMAFRPFFSLPRSNLMPRNGPWSFWMLWRTIVASVFMLLLFSFANKAFALEMEYPPLKNGQPLTSESKDPNGSLLNGLKSKKARNMAFATWELALIARDFPVRRKAIFEDIDRKEGPMWSQIYALELENLKSLEKRMDEYGKPPPKPQEQQVGPQPPNHVATPPINANVWSKAQPKTLADSVGKYATEVATLPGKRANVAPRAKRTLADLKDALLSKQQQEKLDHADLFGVSRSLFAQIARVPRIGWLFREVFSRRLTNAIMTYPHSEISVYVNSVFALSALAVVSLDEDRYGTVHRDVPAIIRSFTSVIKKLEVFRDHFPVHWTDIEAKRECREMELVLDALRQGLERVIAAFEPYASDLRLTRTDIRLAKEATQRPTQEKHQELEMEQVQ